MLCHDLIPDSMQNAGTCLAASVQHLLNRFIGTASSKATTGYEATQAEN